MSCCWKRPAFLSSFFTKQKTVGFLAAALTAVLFLSACGGGGGVTGGITTGEETAQSRTTLTEIRVPEAPGVEVYYGPNTTLDASNSSQGYIMIAYTGDASTVQVQITNPDGQTRNPYPMEIGEYKAFPLSEGSGEYRIDVFALVYDDKYALELSQTIYAEIGDQFSPFLYPNQYVNYRADSQAVAHAREISDASKDDLDFVTNVFRYITENITYDYDLANNIPVNYIPHPDETLASGKGICLDYASLMASMLRSQGIPTKLAVGYSGEAYHAWISVYLKEQGWVDKIVEFKGDQWTLMDPTLAASNDPQAASKYMGDGKNYTVKYNY